MTILPAAAIMESPMTMPGAFSLDHDPDFSRPVAKPLFYVPPSPSASSVLSQSITRTLSNSNLHCRKRPRVDVSHDSASARRGLRRNDESTSSFHFDVPSPAPLVNTDYRIAGGLDTPTAEKFREEELAILDYEQDLRPNRYGVAIRRPADGYFPYTPSSADQGNRKRRLSSSPQPGWGRTVWEFTGEVAGKVFNFCWNTAFQGFHAGGGRGYHMQIDTPTVNSVSEMELKGNQDVFGEEYRGHRSTPIPGGFPDESFIENYMTRPQSHQQDDTPTQHTENGAGSSLKGNWVLVNESYTDIEGSPARKRARPSTANMYGRPISRGNAPFRARIQARSSAGGASYASPRGSGFIAPSQFRPSSSDSAHRHHKRSRSSIAQPRQSGISSGQNTPKSPEVVKFEKKMRRKDLKQDESIHRLNQQMQDMIKEAQQALESKIEVVDGVEDEGYDEGIDVSMVSLW